MLGFFAIIIAIIIIPMFMIYVIYRLASIKYQLNLISQHLNIEDDDDK